MNKKRRLAALVFAALFLITVITSLFIIAHEADHFCIGEDCAVCALVSVCQHTIKALCSALVTAAFAVGCIGFLRIADGLCLKQADNRTPVSLKVKLSN